ncbi:TetR family transcriptional regulator [Natranaerovirga hydrolytica]|uniref:TetR family transcriptional regulator n=1 Tax=Natranaerovirga hydrolytica TaxID=680378 RepID=A0A4R1MIZ0_9FIRM|nr:TetR family transcriptional regulator [Natranaerovirga hydrolytica]TCK92708.1 TetR family transcriptional regulator [Natranaerovirga hydrolytica]
MKEKIDKRQKIIMAAVDVIQEKGFEKTSISEIAKRADVAKGTFYIYFESKNHLTISIAQMILDDQLNRLKRTPSQTLQSVEGLIHTLIEVTYTITKAYKELINFCYAKLAYYESLDQWEKIYEPYYLWLEDKLSYLRDVGALQKDADLSYLANFTVGILEHSAESYYLFCAEEKLEQSKLELKKFLTKVLLK